MPPNDPIKNPEVNCFQLLAFNKSFFLTIADSWKVTLPYIAKQTVNKVISPTEDKKPIKREISDPLNGPNFAKGPNNK